MTDKLEGDETQLSEAGRHVKALINCMRQAGDRVGTYAEACAWRDSSQERKFLVMAEGMRLSGHPLSPALYARVLNEARHADKLASKEKLVKQGQP